jgi:carbon starvation protein
MFNAALIGIGGALWFIVMYRWYGNWLDRKIIEPDPSRTTPAHGMRDDRDYVPSHPAILFGHHFSSIAGAGPIVGPILAYALFGWLPALLWIFLGSVFIGAVHDYTSLMVSVRSRGVSVADLARVHVSPTARWIFSMFLWLALVLVIAVFAVLTARTFVEQPEIVLPSLGLLVLALIFGSTVHRGRVSLAVGTPIGLLLMVALIVAGDFLPIGGSFEFWLIAVLGYSFVAATIPVWILLQPRDYLSMYILIAGIGLAFVSLLVLQPEINGPAFVGFSSGQGPLWPILFITVACGAVSGFHSVVASGTSAKQLRNEKEGRLVAFGGMLTEGALAMIVVLLVASVLFWEKPDSGDLAGYVFGSLLFDKGPNITFGTAMGRVMEAIGIPLKYGIAFGILMLNAFILTTLDTCARLTRYITTESLGKKMPVFANRFVATAVGLVAAYLLTMGNNWSILWPAFGAANQLIAALSLLVVSAYLFGFKKKTAVTIIPGIFMLVTTLGALLYQMFWLYLPQGNTLLAVVAGVLILLGLVVAIEVARRLRRPEQSVTEGDSVVEAAS